MINLRNTNIVFVLIMAALFYCGVPFYVYVVLGIIYTLPLFWGSYYVGSNFYVPILCQGPADLRQVALTFDDGPMDQYTPAILDVLAQHGVEAAFFCIGANIEGHEALLKRIRDEGHLVGNHSFSHHTWFDLFSSRRMSADLARMDQAVRGVLGVTPKLFRPPYGVTNPNLARAIRRGGYTPIGWNVRSLDTVMTDPVKLLSRVTAGLTPGAIVLLHDTSVTTLDMLPGFITAARAAGYTFVRLDKMCNLTPYA
jgi:peptidoglycan/xylan/chitin deacetylase (PgdA/CDA1 family)